MVAGLREAFSTYRPGRHSLDEKTDAQGGGHEPKAVQRPQGRCETSLQAFRSRRRRFSTVPHDCIIITM